jgi:hypothetical protein
MSGFYKLDGTLLYAQERVINAEYELLVTNRADYELPIDGWYWFDSESEAREFFGLPESPIDDMQAQIDALIILEAQS